MRALRKLHAKLCRELVQSERSAIIHTRREARRLGDVPPAVALRELGAHAASLESRLRVLVAARQPLGVLVARSVGSAFSIVRHFLFDRMIDTERSYRGTLLGFHHGVATARLLREVAQRLGDAQITSYCDAMLAERAPLLEAAEQEVTWFARQPGKAIKSGLALTFEPQPE